MASTFKCHACAAEMRFEGFPGRRDECTACGADAHTCKNCQHYDRSAYNECREPQAEVVREKDRANFCDFFYPSAGDGATANGARQDLLSAAEALFRKK